MTKNNMGPVDEAAMALQQYFKGSNAKTSKEAQIKFALVDWTEPEVDPATIDGAYLEMVYQAGTRAGFRTYEDLSEPMLATLGI
jgi:hypothetical protein